MVLDLRAGQRETGAETVGPVHERIGAVGARSSESGGAGAGEQPADTGLRWVRGAGGAPGAVGRPARGRRWGAQESRSPQCPRAHTPAAAGVILHGDYRPPLLQMQGHPECSPQLLPEGRDPGQPPY